MYGPHGAGVAEHLNFEAHLKLGINPADIETVMSRVDMVTGTLVKLMDVLVVMLLVKPI